MTLTTAQRELLSVLDGCGAAVANVTAVKLLIDAGYAVVVDGKIKLTPAGVKEASKP